MAELGENGRKAKINKEKEISKGIKVASVWGFIEIEWDWYINYNNRLYDYIGFKSFIVMVAEPGF